MSTIIAITTTRSYPKNPTIRLNRVFSRISSDHKSRARRIRLSMVRHVPTSMASMTTSTKTRSSSMQSSRACYGMAHAQKMSRPTTTSTSGVPWNRIDTSWLAHMCCSLYYTMVNGMQWYPMSILWKTLQSWTYKNLIFIPHGLRMTNIQVSKWYTLALYMWRLRVLAIWYLRLNGLKRTTCSSKCSMVIQVSNKSPSCDCIW